MKISRQAYAEMFGPTTGDRVRLADTELWIEVEKDFTIYGEEVKFGGGKVIRDGMGQSQRVIRRNRRHGDHECVDHRSLGHRQGRHRHQERIDRAHRKGRQSRCAARRRHRHRSGHRDHRRRRLDRHRRRHRYAHSLYLSAADRRSIDERCDDDAWRRHRPCDRHVRDHMHAGTLAHSLDVESGGELSDEPRLSGQRQREPARCARRADRSGRVRTETARRLGHDTGGDRLLPDGCRQARRAGHDSYRHIERIGLRRRHDRCVQGPHDRHLSHRGRRRRPRARHHSIARACRTCCRRRRIRRCRTPSTPSTNISTC